jgi:hypothetical protein
LIFRSISFFGTAEVGLEFGVDVLIVWVVVDRPFETIGRNGRPVEVGAMFDMERLVGWPPLNVGLDSMAFRDEMFAAETWDLVGVSVGDSKGLW